MQIVQDSAADMAHSGQYLNDTVNYKLVTIGFKVDCAITLFLCDAPGTVDIDNIGADSAY